MDPNAQNDLLTILLPIKGRHPFTKRWLSYLSSNQVKFPIIIADGSNDDEIGHHVKQYHGHLRIDYQHYQERNDAQSYISRIHSALTSVKTPFVLFAANDDFHHFSSIQTALDFMVANDDYSVCLGNLLHFSVVPNLKEDSTSVVYGPVVCSQPKKYTHQSIEDQDCASRLWSHATGYTHTFYGIHRTEQATQNYARLADMKIKDMFFLEHFLTMMSSMDGKIKRLDNLYLARQRNCSSLSRDIMDDRGPARYQYYTNPVWKEDYEKVIGSLTSELASRKGISNTLASMIITAAYAKLIKLDKFKRFTQVKCLHQRIKLLLRTRQLKRKFNGIFNSGPSHWEKQMKTSCECDFCSEISEFLSQPNPDSLEVRDFSYANH